MTGQYHPLLVALSLLVAVMAAWSALDLSQRIQSTDRRAARIWLFSGALVLGTGIWSVNFVGMLAYALPMQTGFDLIITVQSWLTSVGVSLLALLCASRLAPAQRLRAPLALVVGAGAHPREKGVRQRDDPDREKGRRGRGHGGVVVKVETPGSSRNPAGFAPENGFYDGASQRVMEMSVCRDVSSPPVVGSMQRT